MQRIWIWLIIGIAFVCKESFNLIFQAAIGEVDQTQDSVSSGYPNTEERVENTTRSGAFLTKFSVFGYPDETLSWVFDISSQSKQKLKGKRRSKMVKKYLLWNINEFEKSN